MKSIWIIFLCISMPICAIEKRIVVVTAAYNNRHYCERMLQSAFLQKYENWHLIYVDDCSIDGSYEFVQQRIQDADMEAKVTLIKNQSHNGRAIENQYKAIYMCNDKDIIVIIDGDDWLAHDQVFAYLNYVYSTENVWLTYGQFIEYPSGNKGFCSPMPQHIITCNAFREYSRIPSHLRTFYAGLFKKIKKTDLMYDGEFMSMTGDMAAMIPMIEMACDHFKFIEHVLLIYNAENPLNDHKKSKELQRKLDLYIRSLNRYEKISTPFNDDTMR